MPGCRPDHTEVMDEISRTLFFRFQYHTSESAWNKLLKALIRIVGTYTAVTLVLIFIWLQFIAPFIMKELPGIRGAGISLVLILLLIAPMLRAIMMKKNHSAEFQQLCWTASTTGDHWFHWSFCVLYYVSA